jgi:hypothetical protein
MLALLLPTVSLKTSSLADMNNLSTYLDCLAYTKAKLDIRRMISSEESLDINALEDLIEFVIHYENYVK